MRFGRTHALAAAAIGLTVTAAAIEYAHIWRRGRAPLPTETDHVPEAARAAALETVEVAVAGYKTGTARENALLNLLLSYALTAAIVRVSTHTIRARGPLGPFRNMLVGHRHIHHFIPGIVLAFVSGGVSIVKRGEHVDRWLAIPFGAGAALTLDEAALLIELEDVYWTEEGILSVQLTLAAISLLGALAVGGRLVRRGEAVVLESGPGGSVAADRVAPT